MGIESIVICIDNSEWMRNGDFIPTRLHSQNDAVNMMARFKTKDNVETNVGVLTFSDTQVRVPLTNDFNKIAKHLQTVEPKGNIKFIVGLRIAHLVLKHRVNKNHRTRIVAFVASPIMDDPKEMERLAKRLKKENVHVDIVSFGEEEANGEKLSLFVDTLNGKEQKEGKNKCVLVQARPGTMLADALINSPIMAGEDGVPIGMGTASAFDLSMDPEDPELAMALRVSLEEQRQRQEDETRRIQQESLEHIQTEVPFGGEENDMLVQAGTSDLPFNESMQVTGIESGQKDISSMTEEEQLALAIQMSKTCETEDTDTTEEPMETETTDGSKLPGATGEDGKEESTNDEEMQALMQNKDFLQSVLSNLPGVNPEEVLQNLQDMTEAVEEENKQKDKKDDKES